MKQPNKKKYIIILLIVVIGLPVTYAFINILASDNTEETDAGCFEVNYNGEVLSASSLISTTDYLEGTHSQITLSVNDNCEVYETGNILVHTNEETTAPLNDTQALKYKVMSNNEEISKYRKVWCAKESTQIASKNRTLNEFLNCHSHNLESI